MNVMQEIFEIRSCIEILASNTYPYIIHTQLISIMFYSL